MKTPKEKAEELIDNFNLLSTGGDLLAKQCALICVDKIILNCYEDMEGYWQEIKTEIEKL